MNLPIQQIIDKFQDLNQKLANTSDISQMEKLGREHKRLDPQNDIAVQIQAAQNVVDTNTEELKSVDDAEFKSMMQSEIDENKAKVDELSKELLTYLTPIDDRDDMDILLEIRAGAGGDESSLFVGEMLEMYIRMSQEKNFKVNVISTNKGTVGGYKEVMMEIRGADPYSWFKYEGGVHRVQRVPDTEKQGRVHTSTVSVAIMPLIETNNDFKLDMDEVEILITTSGGKGGQSVNTTYSAVSMRHTPTGLEAQSQDERDQQQNRLKCIQVLTSRVYDHYEKERLAKEAAERREQVGTADRSEKIRTYNFPQDRLTDHRYGTNWNQLPTIMTGGIVNTITDIRRMEAQRAIERVEV